MIRGTSPLFLPQRGCGLFYTFKMQRSVDMLVPFFLLLNQFIATCLGQYLSAINDVPATEMNDGELGSRLGYSGGIGTVTSWPRDLGGEYAQQPGYGIGYGQGQWYGGRYDPTPVYNGVYGLQPAFDGRYSQGVGYGGSMGVASDSLNSPGGGYGPIGYGLGYGGDAGIVNGAVPAGYGSGAPAYPYSSLYPPVNARPLIPSAQQQAQLTSNENTNTNININNNLGKQRRGSLIKGLLGMPQL